MSASEGYQLIQRLGNGSAGAVYLADTGSGQVAIRQFQSTAETYGGTTLEERLHFLDAGRQELGLKHPRIVPVLEVIDEAGEAFVAMEYQAGETLEKALASRRMEPQESESILRQVAAGLDFAHAQGVVHGDLKPSNIFLTPTGAKVSDFAISPRALPRNHPVPTRLIHAYLSPEHFRSGGAVNARSDQYSLAAIAYLMYTGKSPYGVEGRDLAAAIQSGTIVPPSKVEPQLPASIDAALLRGLNQDPNARFDSCTEFVAFVGASFLGAAAGARSRVPKGILALAGLLLLAILAAILLWPKKTKPLEAKVEGVPAPTPVTSPVAPPPAPVAPAKPKKGTNIKSTKDTRPPSPGPGDTDGPTAAEAAQAFTIDVLSRRTHKIESGSSFATGDQILGELGQGDLTALIGYEGRRLPRGTLILEWYLNNLRVASSPVAVRQFIEYNNEPTVGTYRLSLKLRDHGKDHEVKSFTFRITP